MKSNIDDDLNETERENFERLSEKNRWEETSDDRCDPLLSFEITEFDASNNDEEDWNDNEDQRKSISEE